MQIPELLLMHLMKLGFQATSVHLEILRKRDGKAGKQESKQLKINLDRWKTVGKCTLLVTHERLTFMTSGDLRTWTQPNCSMEQGKVCKEGRQTFLNLV